MAIKPKNQQKFDQLFAQLSGQENCKTIAVPSKELEATKQIKAMACAALQASLVLHCNSTITVHSPPHASGLLLP